MTRKGYVGEAKPKGAPKTGGIEEELAAILELMDDIQFDEALARFGALTPPAKTAAASARAAYLTVEARTFALHGNFDDVKAAKLLRQALDADPSAPAAVRVPRLLSLSENVGAAKKKAALAEAMKLAGNNDDLRGLVLLAQAGVSDRAEQAAAVEAVKLAASSKKLSPRVASELWAQHAVLCSDYLSPKDKATAEKELAALGLPTGAAGRLAGHRKAVDLGRKGGRLWLVLSNAGSLMDELAAAGKKAEVTALFEDFLPVIEKKAGRELDPGAITEWFERYIEASGGKGKGKLEKQRDKLWGAACDVWNARKEQRARAYPKAASTPSSGDDEEPATYKTLAEVAANHPTWLDVDAVMANVLVPSDPAPWKKLAPLPKKTKLDAWRDQIVATAAPTYGVSGRTKAAEIGGTRAKLGRAWPACGGCERPLDIVIQVQLAAIAALLPKASGDGVLSFLWCQRCHPTTQHEADDQKSALFIVAASSAKAIDRPGSDDDDGIDPIDEEKLTVGPGFDFPRWMPGLLPIEPRDAAINHLGDFLETYDELVSDRRTQGFGGHPHWDQDEQFPACPACEKPMKLLFQQQDIPHPDAFFYIFICDRTKKCPGVKKPSFVIQ